jgi:hypothetical protein
MSLLLLAFLAVAAAPASDKSANETRVMIREYGLCAITRDRRGAAKAILANVTNSELMRDYPRLIDGTCVKVPQGQTVKISFHGDQFRYAIADALVRAELANAPIPDFEAVPLLDHRQMTPPSQVTGKGKPLSQQEYQAALKGYEEAQAFSYLSRYGECVVRQDPAAARALLMADPATPAENQAFAALGTPLGSCVAEGRTMNFGKHALRGTIAINYYRLAVAARTAGGAGA